MLYPPLDQPKPAAAEVWVVDGPAIRFYGLPFPTRATVIRLSDAGLWLHSPTPRSPALAGALAALGPVRHLVAPNWIHYAWAGDWAAACPEATLWAAPGAAKRARARGRPLPEHRALPAEAPPWGAQIAHMLVESRWHSEVVFFHRPSRTLILTDLIEAFEPERMPAWTRPLLRAGGVTAPGGMPRDMRLSFTFGAARERLRDAVQRMLAWAPERVILSHGRRIERDGSAALRSAFGWLL